MLAYGAVRIPRLRFLRISGFCRAELVLQENEARLEAVSRL